MSSLAWIIQQSIAKDPNLNPVRESYKGAKDPEELKPQVIRAQTAPKTNPNSMYSDEQKLFSLRPNNAQIQYQAKESSISRKSIIFIVIIFSISLSLGLFLLS